MVSDKQWDDYFWGLAGAKGGSVHQQLGYQSHHQPKAPGPTTPLPVVPKSQTYAAPRVLTPAEQAEEARRREDAEARMAAERARRARLTMLMNGNRSAWDVLLGRVRSFLDDKGRICLDQNGHLKPTGLVRGSVHRARLRTFVERKSRGMAPDAADKLRKTLKQGRLVCPLTYHGDRVDAAKRSGRAIEPLGEFDRRLRAYLVRAYRDNGSAGVVEAAGAITFG